MDILAPQRGSRPRPSSRSWTEQAGRKACAIDGPSSEHQPEGVCLVPISTPRGEPFTAPAPTPPLLRPQQQRLIYQRRVALTRHFLQCQAVQDVDLAARIVNDPGGLDLACHFRDRGPAHPQHLGHELLRQIDGVATRTVGGLQQPSTKRASMP